MAKERKLIVKNDVDTALIVQVSQEEPTPDLEYEVIIGKAGEWGHDGVVFYFNSEQEFRLWIAALEATFLL